MIYLAGRTPTFQISIKKQNTCYEGHLGLLTQYLCFQEKDLSVDRDLYCHHRYHYLLLCSTDHQYSHSKEPHEGKMNCDTVIDGDQGTEHKQCLCAQDNCNAHF